LDRQARIPREDPAAVRALRSPIPLFAASCRIRPVAKKDCNKGLDGRAE